jgi:hypothetical protein
MVHQQDCGIGGPGTLHCKERLTDLLAILINMYIWECHEANLFIVG